MSVQQNIKEIAFICIYFLKKHGTSSLFKQNISEKQISEAKSHCKNDSEKFKRFVMRINLYFQMPLSLMISYAVSCMHFNCGYCKYPNTFWSHCILYVMTWHCENSFLGFFAFFWETVGRDLNLTFLDVHQSLMYQPLTTAPRLTSLIFIVSLLKESV